MKRIFKVGKEKVFLRRMAASLLVVAALTAVLPAMNLAHEGEDHGESKTPVIAAGTGMVTRTARAGNWEVAIKHPSLEPDKEIPARLFVTRFETNEPIANAQVRVTLTGTAAPVEAVATAGSTAGVYEVRLPPLPQGEYRLAAQVGANGMGQTAQFGALQITPAPPTQCLQEHALRPVGTVTTSPQAGPGDSRRAPGKGLVPSTVAVTVVPSTLSRRTRPAARYACPRSNDRLSARFRTDR